MSAYAAAILWILLLHGWVAADAPPPVGSGVIGEQVGAKCDLTCKGLNLQCNTTAKVCQCDPEFKIVVVASHRTLCLKPAQLGEECLAEESCLKGDVNSKCVQIENKAICECKPEYHEIHDKSIGMLRCVPEPQLNNDLTTLILIGAGMTLLCLLICLVLQIFARARFGPSRAGHYGNANLAPPPVTLSIDQGDIRVSSRNSSQRSSLGGSSRRQSGSLLAPPKGPGDGSRRASNSSIRSTGSNRSHRSYSLKNPGGNHYHQSLHHRPSDPESRSHSQSSQMNLSLNPQANASTGGGSSNNPSPVSQSNQPSPRKAKRSSSAGAI